MSATPNAYPHRWIGAIAALALATTPYAASATPSKPRGVAAQPVTTALLPALDRFAQSLAPEIDAIPAERRQILDRLAEHVRSQHESGKAARLVFVCTHNSRRSQISQAMAAMAAYRSGVERVETFSGGTEATAFNPRAVAALQRAGFAIEKGAGENPRYSVSFAKNRPALKAWSKKFDDPANPSQDFAAVMTCDQADKACPLVSGSTLRIALPFEDPKRADNTPEEAAAYDTRVRQIGAEMLYLFGRVKS